MYYNRTAKYYGVTKNLYLSEEMGGESFYLEVTLKLFEISRDFPGGMSREEQKGLRVKLWE